MLYRSGGYTDSDTGATDDGKGGKRKAKRERKKTANLGPRIKVLRIVPAEAGQEAEDGDQEKAEQDPAKTDVKVCNAG